MESKALHPAIPATTLVLFREAATDEPPGGHHGARDPAVPLPPEILMVKRGAAMAFAAGALAFPGGRVDPDDHLLAARYGGSLAADDAAARVAAIRETLEEAGVAIGFDRLPDADGRDALRHRLLGDVPFSALLDEAGLALDLAALVPFARWRPNFAEARIFDTRFYLAQAHGHQPLMWVDNGEMAALFWARAAETLAACDAGRERIIFPTRRNLERLARYTSFAEAVADAAAHDAGRMITPWIEERGDGRYLCIPGDAGYPVTAERIESADRH